ncbi:hypothetical protein LV779_29660 [Streptomyces thinghirensis]|nr:hypothetical protein [Streptomyces thinghirensis]
MRTLVALGYPALSGRTEEEFAELVAPLRAEAVAHAGDPGQGSTTPPRPAGCPSSWSSPANSPRSSGPCR